jgi:Na+/glutamate symporter
MTMASVIPQASRPLVVDPSADCEEGCFGLEPIEAVAIEEDLGVYSRLKRTLRNQRPLVLLTLQMALTWASLGLCKTLPSSTDVLKTHLASPRCLQDVAFVLVLVLYLLRACSPWAELLIVAVSVVQGLELAALDASQTSDAGFLCCTAMCTALALLSMRSICSSKQQHSKQHHQTVDVPVQATLLKPEMRKTVLAAALCLASGFFLPPQLGSELALILPEFALVLWTAVQTLEIQRNLTPSADLSVRDVVCLRLMRMLLR